MSSFTSKFLSIGFTTYLLVGCGGGGGSADTSTDTDTGTSNTAPEISSSAAVSVEENQTAVIRVSASDSDGDSLSYSLSGTDSALFSISTSGVITFVDAPEYDTQNSFALTVEVSDGTESVTQELVIELTEVSDSEFAMASAAFKNTGSTYYNLPLVYTCDASDGGVSPLLSWSSVPADALYLALTMHSVNADTSLEPQFTLFNIDASETTLAAGDFSIGTAAEGDMTAAEITAAGGVAYTAPCAPGAGTETEYIFTLYALSDLLPLTETATQAQVTAATADALLESITLTTQRIRYDAAAIAADDHVPTSVSSTCAEKEAHFNEYSAIHLSYDCSEADNEMDIISHISDGLKTTLSDQQNSVGIESWIGRLSIPSQAGTTISVAPTFLSSVTNNLSCDGTDPLGVTVDGQLILTYYKQASGATGNTCGATDGDDYSDRDTIVLGEVDQCYGHSPNGEGYHMHGAPVCLMDVHDPSKPIAYMTDGIPLYFGEGGGTVETTAHAILVDAAGGDVTTTNFGAGLYEHLNYFPSDVVDGSNPLNPCNAYDLNADGDVSGYVYYTTKDAPYTVGCFMGEPLISSTAIADNTKLVSERAGWTGQTLGDALDVSVTANYYGTYDSKTYNITELLVEETTSFFDAGDSAQVLWRILDDSDALYDATTTCFEFRYRADASVTDSDEVETICSERAVSETTLDFTPFAS